MPLKRGDVYWVDFEPSVGGEIKKVRPAVIVSNDAANATLNRVLVVPISSQVQKVYPSETLVQLRGQTNKAIANQLQTASKLRFKAFIARISDSDMKLLERAILLQLGITGGSRQ